MPQCAASRENNTAECWVSNYRYIVLQLLVTRGAFTWPNVASVAMLLHSRCVLHEPIEWQGR